MCNLVAFSGTNGVNPDKLRLLLVLGRDRGTDSTGLVVNHELYKGFKYKNEKHVVIEDTCDPLSFVVNKKLPWNGIKSAIVMGHSRKASSGAITEDSIHPYEYTYEEGSKLFFMHNGTIYNEAELRKKYDIAYNQHSTDSDLMGQILYYHGYEKFAEELLTYEGGANFIWYCTHEPNRMYVWKGASISELNNKKYITEERPLFYGQHDGNLYINSTQEPLAAIDCKGIRSFKHNTITIIENGQIVETINIKRRQPVYVPKSYSYGTNSSYNNFTAYKPSTFNIGLPKLSDPHNQSKGGIYWKEGAYYTKGAKVNGEIYFNSKGRIVKHYDSRYVVEVLYFYYGYWIKDKTAYDSVRNFKSDLYEPPVTSFHAEALHKLKTSWYIGNLYTNSNYGIKRRFMYFVYDIHNYTLREGKVRKLDRKGFEIPKEIDEPETTAAIVPFVDVNKSVVDECIEFYNKQYHTKHTTAEQVNRDYQEDQRDYDVEIIPEGITHVDVFQFNLYNGESFKTKLEVNDYYFKNYSVMYNKTWPITNIDNAYEDVEKYF